VSDFVTYSRQNFSEHKLNSNKGWGGGMSEHIVVPRDNVFPLPLSLSLEEGGESHSLFFFKGL
jgi:hypothetical protein